MLNYPLDHSQERDGQLRSDLRLIVIGSLKLPPPTPLSFKKNPSLKFACSRVLKGFRERLEDGLEKLSVPDRIVSFH